MRRSVKYELVGISLGVLVFGMGYSGAVDVLMVIGVGIFAIGGFFLFLDMQAWYCAACGQFLGRGDKPSRCKRCGSNRVTTNDPGAVR